MDPATAVMNLATAILELVKLNTELIKTLPAAQQAEYAKMLIEDQKQWLAFLQPMLQLLTKMFNPSATT